MGSASWLSESPGTDAAVSIRRFVNDEIAQVAARLDRDQRDEYEFVCECGELSCRRTLEMTLADYRALSAGGVLGHHVSAAN